MSILILNDAKQRHLLPLCCGRRHLVCWLCVLVRHNCNNQKCSVFTLPEAQVSVAAPTIHLITT